MYSRSTKGGEKGDPNRNPWLAKMSTMEHLTTENYLKSINRLFQRTANTRCSLKHLNFKYNRT